MENCHENAMVLKEGLEKTGYFNIVSKDDGVPLVAFSLKDNSRHDEFEISDMLRRFGWIVPAYTMPADAQHITVLRVVIREDFSRTLAERLVVDITKVIHELDSLPAKIKAKMSVLEENGRNGTTCAVKKTEMERQREITDAWKKFVLASKSNKNKICWSTEDVPYASILIIARFWCYIFLIFEPTRLLSCHESIRYRKIINPKNNVIIFLVFFEKN